MAGWKSAAVCAQAGRAKVTRRARESAALFPLETALDGSAIILWRAGSKHNTQTKNLHAHDPARGDSYQRLSGIAGQGSVMSYRQCYLDLDPTYHDSFGRPLLRMTFDWQENEHRLMESLTATAQAIAQAMGAQEVFARRGRRLRYSIAPYQTTHNTGGAVFGDDPGTSALNEHLQSWDVSNVFVLGAPAFPQNAGRNPTGPVGP